VRLWPRRRREPVEPEVPEVPEVPVEPYWYANWSAPRYWHEWRDDQEGDRDTLRLIVAALLNDPDMGARLLADLAHSQVAEVAWCAASWASSWLQALHGEHALDFARELLSTVDDDGPAA
jgi:hypothetical protein